MKKFFVFLFFLTITLFFVAVSTFWVEKPSNGATAVLENRTLLYKQQRHIASLGGETTCNGTPLRTNDPTAILAWIRNGHNLNRSIEDIICCMPAQLREDYKIVHSSLSAQQSHYHSPRLLFGSIADGFMMSISGGDPSLPQSESVEIMFDNPRTGQLELFDVEFEENGRRHLSDRNPEACIQCHGNNGQVGVAGPRPIFNQNPWPRTVSAANINSDVCPNRAAFFRQSQDVAFRSVRENPRFSCLPEPRVSNDVTLKNANTVSFGIDGELDERNRERVVREMRYSNDFEGVKNFLIGVVLGCFSDPPEGKGATATNLFPFGQPEAWLAPDFLSQMTQPPIGLDRSLQGVVSQDRMNAILERASQTYRQNIADEEQRFSEMTRELASGGRPQIPITMGLMGCEETFPAENRLMYSNLATQYENPTSQQYFTNHIQRLVERGLAPANPDGQVSVIRESLVLWAFESRGVDTGTWNMELRSFNPRSLTQAILALPETTTWNNQFNFENSAERAEGCRQLQSRSLRQSGRNSEGTGVAPGQDVDTSQ